MMFFQWWYGSGWKHQFSSLPSSIDNVMRLFSVRILARTLFAPWKQLKTQSFSDTALDDKLRAMVDNLVSRVIGFFIRLFTILTAFVAIIAQVIFKVFMMIIWPFLPIMPIALLLLAVWELF